MAMLPDFANTMITITEKLQVKWQHWSILLIKVVRIFSSERQQYLASNKPFITPLAILRGSSVFFYRIFLKLQVIYDGKEIRAKSIHIEAMLNAHSHANLRENAVNHIKEQVSP